MAVKYHIGANGKPAQCSAHKRACKFGGAEGHYSSPEAAQIAAEAKGMKSALASHSVRTPVKSDNIQQTDKAGVVRVFGNEMTAARARVLNDARETARAFISMRSNIEEAKFGAISLSPKNARIAAKRMNKLADYAMARGNEHDLKKISNAVYSGMTSFKTDKGNLLVKTAMTPNADKKTWDDSREAAESKLTELAQDPSVKSGQYKFEGASVTVSEGGLNPKAASELDADTLAKISAPVSKLDPNLAKKYLPEEKLGKVLQSQQVAEFMDGDISKSRSKDVKPFDSNNVSGETKQEQFESVAKNYGTYVRHMQNTVGGKTDLKNKTENVKKLAKENTARIQGELGAGNSTRPVIFGGGRANTAVIVSNRDVVSKNAVKEHLSPAETEAISRREMAISKKKAQEVLSPEQYNKLFNVRQVSIREANVKKK